MAIEKFKFNWHNWNSEMELNLYNYLSGASVSEREWLLHGGQLELEILSEQGSSLENWKLQK